VRVGVDTDFDTFDLRPSFFFPALESLLARSNSCALLKENQRLAAADGLACILPLIFSMLKISITDTRAQRRLLVEGRLVAPWVAELRTTWERVKSQHDHRQVVIDIGNVTLISQEGENALLHLLNEGAKFRCCNGVLTKHVLQELARRCQKNTNELVDTAQRPGVREPTGSK